MNKEIITLLFFVYRRKIPFLKIYDILLDEKEISLNVYLKARNFVYYTTNENGINYLKGVFKEILEDDIDEEKKIEILKIIVMEYLESEVSEEKWINIYFKYFIPSIVCLVCELYLNKEYKEDVERTNYSHSPETIEKLRKPKKNKTGYHKPKTPEHRAKLAANCALMTLKRELKKLKIEKDEDINS